MYFRYAMSISSSLTHFFAHSLPPWLVSLLFFLPVFMFYATIKTTREQHNIIRYVSKILTKKYKTWRLVVKTTLEVRTPIELCFCTLLDSFRRFLISTIHISFFFVGIKCNVVPPFNFDRPKFFPIKINFAVKIS